MTTNDLTEQAIGVLTSLAQQTRVRGEGTPHEQTESVDVADLVAHILTTVAANLGGAETLLAGRPGSWEADLVRQLVTGTAGHDVADLAPWRTEPVRLPLNADHVFYDLGIGSLYDDESDAAAERADDDALTDEQREEADSLAAAIEQWYEADKAAYAEAYRETARRYLADLGATCTVEVVDDTADLPEWDGFAELVGDYARQHTPLPMTGQAPDWSRAGLLGDTLRQAGLTYTDRATGATALQRAITAAEARLGEPLSAEARQQIVNNAAEIREAAKRENARQRSASLDHDADGM